MMSGTSSSAAANSASPRTLILLRHAKSAWGLDVDDHERPLTKRGRQDAVAAGALLAARGLHPDLVWCSTAERARETWRRATDGGLRATDLTYTNRIYEAFTDELIRVLAMTPPSARTVLLVGHSPSLPELVETLAEPAGKDGSAQRKAWDRLAEKYPTSGCAVLSVEPDWSSLAPGSSRLVSFDVPRGDGDQPSAKKTKQEKKAKKGRLDASTSKKSSGAQK